MKKMNKVMALGLATTMLLGSTVTAFAAPGDSAEAVTGGGTGSGAAVHMDVYSVTVPTGDALTKAFDFVVDPDGLVAKTEAAFGEDVTLGDNAGVLFKGETKDSKLQVSGTSKELPIINKSAKIVSLKIEPVVKDSTASDKYAAGYSSTKDFSGSGDDEKGLYFGLIATGEAEKALSATAATINSVILSDADEYELKATNASNATTYSYAAKDGAEGKTYNLQVTAALNYALPESTWKKIEDAATTALGMPTLEIKFTPTQVKAKAGQAATDADGNIWFAVPTGTDEDGGLGTTAPSDVTWNGKTVTASVEAGWGKITWADLIDAYNTAMGTDFDADTDDPTAIYSQNIIQWTTNGQAYYAEANFE